MATSSGGGGARRWVMGCSARPRPTSRWALPLMSVRVWFASTRLAESTLKLSPPTFLVRTSQGSMFCSSGTVRPVVSFVSLGMLVTRRDGTISSGLSIPSSIGAAPDGVTTCRDPLTHREYRRHHLSCPSRRAHGIAVRRTDLVPRRGGSHARHRWPRAQLQAPPYSPPHPRRVPVLWAGFGGLGALPPHRRYPAHHPARRERAVQLVGPAQHALSPGLPVLRVHHDDGLLRVRLDGAREVGALALLERLYGREGVARPPSPGR